MVNNIILCRIKREKENLPMQKISFDSFHHTLHIKPKSMNIHIKSKINRQVYKDRKNKNKDV